MTINVKITGSEKQVKWATDIINHPANFILGMIEVEKRFGDRHQDSIDVLTKTLDKYVKWVENGAASMGGSLKGGWVIDNKAGFKDMANQMLNVELKAAGKDHSEIGRIQ